jgi:dipeptidyl aminopeptidase/acylaminoacyl peptidase
MTMTDPMSRIVSFFHENGNLARSRELREALEEFETRMPERIRERILSKLPAEERAPTGWSRFQRFPDFKTAAFHGLGWERRAQDSGDLVEWVGFGWWHFGKHDYLLNPQDRPGHPCRWIGWWKPGVEDQSPEETQLFNKARNILSDLTGSPPDQGLVDSEPQHAEGWPYFLGVPAAEVDALRVDTDEFATVLSKLLPEIRRAAEQVS